jgi:hypothetical protein
MEPQWLVTQLVKQYPSIYAAGRFIDIFTRSHCLFLSWAIWIHFTASHFVSLQFISILSSHLRPGLSSGLFPSCSLITVHIFHMNATCRAHLILDLITQIIYGQEYELWNSFCNFLGPCLSPPLVDLDMFLSTLFWNTLNPCFFSFR